MVADRQHMVRGRQDVRSLYDARVQHRVLEAVQHVRDPRGRLVVQVAVHALLGTGEHSHRRCQQRHAADAEDDAGQGELDHSTLTLTPGPSSWPALPSITTVQFPDIMISDPSTATVGSSMNLVSTSLPSAIRRMR